MNTRKIAAVCTCGLAIILICVHLLSSGHAAPWVCGTCGNENDGNFCENCGAYKGNEPERAKASTNAQGRRDNDLSYFASEKIWTENGTGLAIKGGFYNLTSEYDLVIKNARIRLEDAAGNIIKMVQVNVNYVSVVPHGGFVSYNFKVKDIPGGAGRYATTDVFPVAEAEFVYEEHRASNCPYCHNVDTRVNIANDTVEDKGAEGKRPCDYCKGTGTVECKLCDGTGKNKIYDSLSTILKVLESPKCENCGGEGLVECPSCHGDRYY